jgi:hypothetical protein
MSEGIEMPEMHKVEVEVYENDELLETREIEVPAHVIELSDRIDRLVAVTQGLRAGRGTQKERLERIEQALADVIALQLGQ